MTDIHVKKLLLQPTVEIKFLTLTAQAPFYASDGAAGMDLRADLPEGPIVLKSLERALIPTGLGVAIAEGFEGQVRPRSGNAIKRGLTVLNSPGTVDCDYRGSLGVILINLSPCPQQIEHGERIAQLVITPVARATRIQVKEFSTTTVRGADGFGSTGA